MECPYCGVELIYDDYYGIYLGGYVWNKMGDIYQCNNDKCSAYQEYFYIDMDGYLWEGYPC